MVDLFDLIIIYGNLSVGIFSMFVAHYLGLFKFMLRPTSKLA